MKSHFWPVSHPMSSISVLLILGLVVHLREPLYPRVGEALGSLRWNKPCWDGSAPAWTPLHWQESPQTHLHSPRQSTCHQLLSHTCLSNASFRFWGLGWSHLPLSFWGHHCKSPYCSSLFYLLILIFFFILRPPPQHRIDLSYGISPVLRVVKRYQNCMYMRGKLKLEKPVYSSQRDSSVSMSIL